MIHHWNDDGKFVEKEFIRMGFDSDSRWRISDINKNFELCNTYPRFLIIPSSFKDEDLESVAKFRYFRRIPTAVWRHIKNGCFIVRSSQPTVGWFGWFRNELDENLVQSYVTNSMPLNSERIIDDNNEDDINNFNQIDNDKHHESVDNNDDQCDQQTLVDENEQQDDQKLTSQIKTTHLDQNKPMEQKNYQINKSNDMNTTNVGQNINTETNLSSSNNHSPIGNGKTTDSANTNKDSTNSTTATTNPDVDDKKINLECSTSISQQLTINGNGTLSLDNNISTVNESETVTTLTSKMLIIDARSYTAAMANRAKGGGCECSEYYQRCEVQFMNLANIHSIRKSFHAIRSVCEAYSEQSNNWVSFLDNSRWLHHISGLIKSALLIVDTIDIEEKSILIHCSDGWDRTPQLVALAEIMLDPHYRTFDGFRTLIQREWLDFGHKFADRCGSNPCNEDPNERCPVFLQWLDCVQQLLMQYPKHFEFNSLYLDKLNRHTYSNVFGTFSYNSTQERILSRVDEKILSLWSYFDSSRRRFRNDKYVESDEILRPSFKVRDLHFWKEVYLPPIRNQTPYMPISNNIDNKKFYDSMYIDELTRTVCK